MIAALTPGEQEIAISQKMRVQDIKDSFIYVAPLEKVTQIITFKWNDKIIPYCEDLLRRAIIKAEYLKTLDLNEVL
jgi:hypothetical protein